MILKMKNISFDVMYAMLMLTMGQSTVVNAIGAVMILIIIVTGLTIVLERQITNHFSCSLWYSGVT